MLASKKDTEATLDYSAINRWLKEDARTLQLYDQLAPDDPRRRGLSSDVYGLLIESGRYQDALQAQPYSSMSASFELSIQERSMPANITNPEQRRQAQRNYAVTSAAKNIEVLAGAGDLAHAKSFVERLLAYDGSEETKAVLQKSLVRAGHPELLAASAK
jgi:hypothetical protein